MYMNVTISLSHDLEVHQKHCQKAQQTQGIECFDSIKTCVEWMQEKRLNCVVIISKSRWWQAPVTTSKDKKTKQIVEIFLRGRVVWRWWGAIVRSLFNPFCFLARLLATTHRGKKPQKRNEMAGEKRDEGRKKGGRE